jgi:HEAT repeat protein
VRWWAVTGLGVRGGPSAAVLSALADADPAVRVAAAEALRRLGLGEKGLPVLTAALQDANPWVRHAAALALDELGAKALPARAALAAAVKDTNSYVVRVAEHALKALR